jgi:hypothetical protein
MALTYAECHFLFYNTSQLSIHGLHMKNIRANIQKFSTTALWVAIAIYTVILPQAIIIYRNLEARFGQNAVGKIPLMAVIMIGALYVIYGYRRNQNFKHLIYLIPSAAIALAIIMNEPNPNKHIHIPEYILMAWLLYLVISKGYSGKGLFLLVFLCGSMLGVVDELQQGLHPKRFYGWIDMSINSASTVIGILTIVGLVRSPGGDTETWEWTKYSHMFRTYLWFLAFGIAGAILQCIYLFQVQSTETFVGIYPQWLLGWQAIFLTFSFGMIWRGFQNVQQTSANQNKAAATMRLWVSLPLIILSYMYFLVLFVAISGMSFR